MTDPKTAPPKTAPNAAPKAAIVWCPFPNRESAHEAAKILLDEGLIRCANLLGEVESIFNWQDETKFSTEIGVLLKTRTDLLDSLIERIGVLHPYDTPAILGMHCDVAHPATLTWLGTLGIIEGQGQ